MTHSASSPLRRLFPQSPLQPLMPPQGAGSGGVPRPAGAVPRTPTDVAPGDIAVGVVIGRASEYFDFFVFGLACALVFPAVFFPFADGLQGTLWSFAVFAVAFVVRPIGTLLGMALQRRAGRGAKLGAALLLLGTATCSMALLPGYNQIGALAIVLLVAARIAQGLAQGASWDGLPSLLAVNAPPERRGWYAMLGQLGAPLGFVIAGSIFGYLRAHLADPDFLSWGWRFAFFMAFALNVVALFARLRLVVTHEYESALRQHELEPAPVRELLSAQGNVVALGAFAALASFALFHLVTIFPLSWVQLYGQQPLSHVLGVQVLGALLAGVAMPVSGWIANRIGRRSTLGAMAMLIGVFALAAPWLLDGGRSGQTTFILVGFVLLGLSYAQSSGAVNYHFQPRLRYTGAALTADLAWLFGAAFAPLVALGLSARFGLGAVSLYLLSGVACTLLALRINRSLSMRD